MAAISILLCYMRLSSRRRLGNDAAEEIFLSNAIALDEAGHFVDPLMEPGRKTPYYIDAFSRFVNFWGWPVWIFFAR
jgi:hypothetical protein